MQRFGVWRFRLSRLAGRIATRLAAAATLGSMPPFVSASAVVLRGDDILVVLDPVRREPVLPGGHLKWGERPEEAVTREVREETGYHIRPEELVGVVAGPEWAGEKGVVRVIYTAALTGGVLRSSDEGRAVWMPAAEVVAGGGRDAPLVARALEGLR